MSDTHLHFGTRVWFAWACFFRVLFDGAFAGRAWTVKDAMPAAPELPAKPVVAPARREEKPPKKADFDADASALQLLALLQREGRFVDFVQQDLGDHPDADIGAAARVVHEGCRKALRGHVEIEPVRREEEGSKIHLEVGFDPALVKLSGDVKGQGPHDGVLRHRGWRAASVKLPAVVKGHDAHVLCAAEVEV